ncbi:DUF4258 domain-containing protein, partial [Candidatus Sumerlaeota bacterium]|nr:DUF4258 domain-containing protein [Candidatus Sumerlaeota bacterium]
AILECLQTGRYYYSIHAHQRFRKRAVTQMEIKEALRNGKHEKSKDRYDTGMKRWAYSIRGSASAGERRLRIVISFRNDDGVMIVVTVIGLE